eukprot:scaffold2173_cov416-Prasinococcus_capsulatus_cf.AAC.9
MRRPCPGLQGGHFQVPPAWRHSPAERPGASHGRRSSSNAEAAASSLCGATFIPRTASASPEYHCISLRTADSAVFVRLQAVRTMNTVCRWPRTAPNSRKPLRAEGLQPQRKLPRDVAEAYKPRT